MAGAPAAILGYKMLCNESHVLRQWSKRIQEVTIDNNLMKLPTSESLLSEALTSFLLKLLLLCSQI